MFSGAFQTILFTDSSVIGHVALKIKFRISTEMYTLSFFDIWHSLTILEGRLDERQTNYFSIIELNTKILNINNRW
jgi:hypothetical protein